MQSSSSTPTLGDGFGGPTPTATPIGGRSVASPAMIRILLTPAHAKVSPDDFEMMAGVIRRIESIRLSDLPKSSSRASTSALGKMGEVHLSFVTSYDPSHSFLAPFNLHRQVLGVLGLSTFDSEISMEEVEHSPAALRQLHPSAVIHRVFAFDTGATRPQTVDLSSLKNPAEAIEKAGRSDSSTSTGTGFSGRGTSGLVVFPAVRKDLKDVKFYLKTLFPEYIGSLLDGLDTIVKGLQGKPLETPRETLDGNLNNAPVSASNKLVGAAGLAVGTAASRASALFSSFSAEEKKTDRNRKTSQSLASSGPLGAGRYAKIKADYYLLSGDLWNALHTYDSCLSLLGKEKAMAGGQDAVWYASGLEGWAVSRYLVRRMGGTVEEKAPCLTLPLGGAKEKEKSEFQFSAFAWSDIAEAYSQALTIYTKCLAPTSYLLDSWKSITPDTPRDYTHPLIHTSACLAYARILLAIWASGGWNGETFDQLLYGGVPPALAETTRPTPAVYTQHCTASGVQRNDIAAPASLAMTNSSTNGLKLLDQVNLFSSLAAIFGAVGFARKEAYAIRRLQALVVSLIASGVLLQSKETTTASQVIRTSGDDSSMVFGTMVTMMSSVGAGENADSILVLALQICQTYGIDVQQMPLKGLDKKHILSRAAVDVKSGKRLSSPLVNRGRSSWGYNMSPIQASDWQKYANEENWNEGVVKEAPPFGWIQQQIFILKDTLGICEMLQDDISLLYFASILLRCFWPFLDAEDQTKLKYGIEKVQTNLRAKGQESLLEYWGPSHILDDLQILGRSEGIQQRNIRDIKVQSDGGINGLEGNGNTSSGKKNASTSSNSTNLIDGEVAHFSVTLYNPLSIVLEVERIRLDLMKASSVGPNFEAEEERSIQLLPHSYHTIQLTGTPHGEGKILLRGIVLKLPSCVERRFPFERTDGDNVKHLVKLQSDCDDYWTRTKKYGLDARHGNDQKSIMAKPKGKPEDRFTSLQVISKVPRLLLQSSNSLRNGTLVLFDGEERMIQLTLENRSQLDADYIHFTLEDDLKSDVLSLLAEGHLDPVDVHDLEDDLLHRPFLSIDSRLEAENQAVEAAKVQAGEKKTFSFRVRGKLDVRKASIKIEYGNTKIGKELGRDQFWSRRMDFRFDVRVVPVIAVDALEFKRIEESRGEESRGEESRGEERKGNDDKEVKDEELVMVGLRVHNYYSSSVTIDWKVSNAISNVQRQIAANSTTHIQFIMPKFSQSDSQLSQQIPNLIERQFILSKIQQTQEESRLVRMRFWIRNALLGLIESRRWKIDRTGQSGEIGLDGLHIKDDHMLSTIRTEAVSIKTRFDVEKVKRNEFVHFIGQITNACDRPIQGHFRLVPIVHERLMNHIQCTTGKLVGRLNNFPLPPQQSTDIQVGLCFLTGGTFHFNLLITENDRTIAEKKIEVVVY